MTDIVERLHEEGLGFGIGPAGLCQEAAEEIQLLRAMVQELADDLEAEVKARSKGELARRIERDLEPVERARKMLEGE